MSAANPPSINPPVAQLDNATDSDSGEQGFKSLRAGQREVSRSGYLKPLFFEKAA